MSSKAIKPESIAKKLQLSEHQERFANAYIYFGMNGLEAVKLAGYQVNYDESKYSEDKRAYYEELVYRGIAKENLENPKVIEYIKTIREQLNNSLVLDKYWVVEKLKKLADTGSESTQLKATELLGKTLSMFNEVQKVEVTEESAGDLVKAAFEKRKQQQKELKEKNILQFKASNDTHQ